MNFDGDKVYTKLVAFHEIYNFVVQTFFIEVILGLKKLIYCPDLSFRYLVNYFFSKIDIKSKR
jgi:hypothetical protein